MRVIHLSLVFSLVGVGIAFLLFLALFSHSVALAFVLAMLTTALTVAIVVLTSSRCQQRYRRILRERQEERAELEEQLNALLSQSCCEEDRLAADYDGWHGSVHTFYFASAQFVRAFEEANRGKCLRGGQIHH
jgi:hypothetical protein